MYYTGIDLHKFTSYLTTVDSSGAIVKQTRPALFHYKATRRGSNKFCCTSSALRKFFYAILFRCGSLFVFFLIFLPKTLFPYYFRQIW